MKITPLEIKKQEFATKFRGYSPDEVHSYLEMVADELENAVKKNLELEQKLTLFEEKLASYARIENTLQETLMTIQRTAEETKVTAEKKADTLVAEARIRAERMLAEANEKFLLIQREFADLRNQRDNFLVSFKSLLVTQQSLLDIIEKRETNQDNYVPLKKKVDLSNEELEKVVNEFEKELSAKSQSHAQDSSGTPPGEVK
jgi:cell division initiation protein